MVLTILIIRIIIRTSNLIFRFGNKKPAPLVSTFEKRRKAVVILLLVVIRIITQNPLFVKVGSVNQNERRKKS